MTYEASFDDLETNFFLDDVKELYTRVKKPSSHKKHTKMENSRPYTAL
jgi:hypothetical protein